VRAMSPPAQLHKRSTLSARITDDLRIRLSAGEWPPGAKLPTEHDLAKAYQVSRATIRAALQALDGRGLIATVHGVGTFATAASTTVSADVTRLESISETIVRMGRVPSSTFRSITLGEASEVEADALSIPYGSMVVTTRREIMADRELVAYSHDVIPRDLLGENFSLTSVSGSLFSLLAANGVIAATALSSLHASDGSEIGWGERPVGQLYLRLDQVHFDDRTRGVAMTRSWFIEGRFQFSLVRVAG
jgi:GntR family transcriptional regulator